MIGDIYILKKDCLGNKAGVFGIVYEEYPDFDYPDKKGISVIFPNGRYDGFSKDEQDTLLYLIGNSQSRSDYIFENVMMLNRDFKKGYFNLNISEIQWYIQIYPEDIREIINNS